MRKSHTSNKKNGEGKTSCWAYRRDLDRLTEYGLAPVYHPLAGCC